MGKKNATTSTVSGAKETSQGASHQTTPAFFNQKPKNPNSTVVRQRTARQEVEPAPEELRLVTTTDVLLAGILKELQTHNAIEFMKLNAQEQKELAEQQANKEIEERDKARFEEIRHSMFM